MEPAITSQMPKGLELSKHVGEDLSLHCSKSRESA
jgi:hypothetical protein